MRYLTHELLDTPTPEAYGCGAWTQDGGCRRQAVQVLIVQTENMRSPGFYGECEAHKRDLQEVSRC